MHFRKLEFFLVKFGLVVITVSMLYFGFQLTSCSIGKTTRCRSHFSTVQGVSWPYRADKIKMNICWFLPISWKRANSTGVGFYSNLKANFVLASFNQFQALMRVTFFDCAKLSSAFLKGLYWHLSRQ